MSLIKSTSGIRGNIGGIIGEALTPIDIVSITSAFGKWILKNSQKNNLLIIGRDARISGITISKLVSATLQNLGIDVIDLGLTTTPTLSLAVMYEKACGGIAITASHNPAGWNALKLFNNKGEYIDASAIDEVLEIEKKCNYEFISESCLGQYNIIPDYIEKHIEKILSLPLVDPEAIRRSKFKIAVDGVNSSGGIAVPQLLKALGIDSIVEINCTPNGFFAHTPEPVPHNLTQLSNVVKSESCSLGIAVDPDVDRLTIIDENGDFWGEEYTLVAAADYVLSHNRGGNTVSNLSSCSALRDITKMYGGTYASSAVGEAHVVAKMKTTNSIIGGEGNGGVIYPELHYGRDSLVGIALILSHLAKSQKKASELRAGYPNYFIEKYSFPIVADTLQVGLEKIKNKYKEYQINLEDGVKIIFEDAWVHIRQSNTEPIIRIFVEAKTKSRCKELADQFADEFNKMPNL